jgi:Ni/Co efflux regulator RcnB
MKRLLIVAAVVAIATPALADEVGVHVGPVGAGVTVGDGHRDYDRDRDRDRDHTTVIKEREPSDRTTVIKKENDDGTRSKTIIHDRD